MTITSGKAGEAEQQDQQAAGDMFFFGIAHPAGSKRLVAVFSAADGARSYGVEALTYEPNFEFMPETAKRSARNALSYIAHSLQDVAEGYDKIENYPDQAAMVKAVNSVYRILHNKAR